MSEINESSRNIVPINKTDVSAEGMEGAAAVLNAGSWPGGVKMVEAAANLSALSLT